MWRGSEEVDMATGKSAAVEAYERAEDEMRRHQARVAEARKTAARELGDTVLATGAGKLPVAQLKAILGAVVTMGGDQALVALGVTATGAGGGKSNGRGPAARGQNGADGEDGKSAGVDA